MWFLWLRLLWLLWYTQLFFFSFRSLPPRFIPLLASARALFAVRKGISVEAFVWITHFEDTHPTLAATCSSCKCLYYNYRELMNELNHGLATYSLDY